MPQQTVQLDLMAFVEQQILPRYNHFDRAHGLNHVLRVINKAVALAQKMGVDVDMCYTIAAYHDLGLEGPRAIHHLTSGKILQSDARLKKWFTAEQIRIMKEAVEDHRASTSHTPRSIYGKIAAEADRELKPDIVYTRTVGFGLDHFSEMNEEEQWKRFKDHITDKYGPEGYIKLWIPGSENEKALEEIRNDIRNEEKLRATFNEIYQQMKKG